MQGYIHVKSVDTIIAEMRKVAEVAIEAAGEGTQINLAMLTSIIDSWRYGLEEYVAQKGGGN